MIRSMRGAIGRRIAIGAGSRAELRELVERTRRAARAGPSRERRSPSRSSRPQIAVLRARLDRIPYLDPIDLRFRNRVSSRCRPPRR